MITRKLGKEIIERLEELIEDAADYGHSFIEAKLPGKGKFPEKTYGFEEARLKRRRQPGTDITATYGVDIVSDGIVNFYNDNKQNRWGYILKTEKNMRILASELKNRSFIVTDPAIVNELKEIAKENGWPTEYVERTVSATEGVVRNEAPVEDARDAEIEELKKQLEELKAANDEAKPKPLAGKKADKK